MFVDTPTTIESKRTTQRARTDKTTVRTTERINKSEAKTITTTFTATKPATTGKTGHGIFLRLNKNQLLYSIVTFQTKSNITKNVTFYYKISKFGAANGTFLAR